MRNLATAIVALSLAAFGYATAQEDHSAHQTPPPPGKSAPKADDKAATGHDMHAHCMAMMQAKAGPEGSAPAPKMKMKMKMKAKAGDEAHDCAEMMKMMQGRQPPAAKDK